MLLDPYMVPHSIEEPLIIGGDIAHVRPSGNAPQLGVYANAGSERRADFIVKSTLRGLEGVVFSERRVA